MAEWERLTPALKKSLAGFKDTLKDLAIHADAERVTVKGDNGAPDLDSNEPF